MNTTPDAPIGHIIAEEAGQTVLLIIVSVVGTWLCLYVPWQVSADPCLVAAAAAVVATGLATGEKRCAWTGTDPLLAAYHDEEWSVPLHDYDALIPPKGSLMLMTKKSEQLRSLKRGNRGRLSEALKNGGSYDV